MSTIDHLSNQIDAIHHRYPEDSAEYRTILSLNDLLLSLVVSPTTRDQSVIAVKQMLADNASRPELRQDMRQIVHLFTSIVEAVAVDAAKEIAQ